MDLNGIANSTASTVVSRLTIMALPFLIGIIGWFSINSLTELKENQGKFWGAIAKVDGNLNEIKTNVAVGNSQFSAHVHDDDVFKESVKSTLTDHETRLRLVGQPPR